MPTSDLDDAIREYRLLHEEVPIPTRLPTSEEVDAVQAQLGVCFHPDLRTFLLRASDVHYGNMEPVTLTKPDSHTFLPRVCGHAWDRWDIPRELVPICADNANYHCLTPDGQVVYWGHDDGEVTATWTSLADWIREVLIEEQQDR